MNAQFPFNTPDPQNLQVLEAYQVRAAAAKAATEDFNGWLERIDALEGLTTADLTRIHGQLIATGNLKFEISGRSVGLCYKLSDRGRQSLEKARATAVLADKHGGDESAHYAA
ncbi:MAG: hypothetical protein GY758_00450 [Fuerstiella sp.]|jgi:hypothetical protein|nr:hypothetical protein [Fuerstiella sp.]MCP4510457.1 hypothetical protein [Fuerstiella sp.]MDG2131816.1 hypothetical protein [Fuerstiella sp.]